MWDKEVLESKLEKLKFIKNALYRSIEFWSPTYLDSQNTKFEDNPLRKDESIDAIINAAILYLEDKLKEKVNGEIVKTKTYKSDIINGICKCCSNCIRYKDEEGQNFYCLIDDEYKYPEDKNFKCPWLIYKEEENK